MRLTASGPPARVGRRCALGGVSSASASWFHVKPARLAATRVSALRGPERLTHRPRLQPARTAASARRRLSTTWKRCRAPHGEVSRETLRIEARPDSGRPGRSLRSRPTSAMPATSTSSERGRARGARRLDEIPAGCSTTRRCAPCRSKRARCSRAHVPETIGAASAPPWRHSGRDLAAAGARQEARRRRRGATTAAPDRDA